jgi:hypothetical protein
MEQGIVKEKMGVFSLVSILGPPFLSTLSRSSFLTKMAFCQREDAGIRTVSPGLDVSLSMFLEEICSLMKII